MKMTRLYPLALGGLLLPAIANAQTSQQDESTLVVTASKQSSRSASANNVSSTVVSAPELSDAGVTASDKLPRVLPGLNIENSGNMLFRRSRYAASLQRRTSIIPPSPCMSMASLSFPPTPSRRLPMCKAWSCCEAHRERYMAKALRAGSSTSSPSSRTARRAAILKAASVAATVIEVSST